MHQKAVLVFAYPTGLDLARRHLPRCLRPLLSWRRFRSGASGADFHLFTSGQRAPRPGYQCHQQSGGTFAERLEAAAKTIADLGYDEIVLVGSDCPTLTAADIAAAFAALKTKRLVLGPDHRGGCYLIALHARDRHLLSGIQWNKDRDRAQLGERLPAVEIMSLGIKQDVDSWLDLHLLAKSGHTLAARVVSFFLLGRSTAKPFVDLTAHHTRVRQQIPPPAFAV